ncbi:MAG: hypothetical protein SAJ12_15485 [Jaaginema sp. PMC 1079.18]|nr:hypothetical protein [Jaaginema sp. PMC 1080.18]MEC4852386.1 hypothetical protein [Jaaginema sp. PMC 1079.18]MEC4867638.1 hypothetical protein [Jaaginema sp. PMC 1078.18]
MKNKIKHSLEQENDSDYTKTPKYDSLLTGLSQVLADTYTLQQQVEQSQEDRSGQLTASVRHELQKQQQDLETATDAIANTLFDLVQPATPGTEFTRPSYIPAVENTDSRPQKLEHLVQGNEMLYQNLLKVIDLAKASENEMTSFFLSQRAEIHQNNAQTLRSFL